MVSLSTLPVDTIPAIPHIDFCRVLFVLFRALLLVPFNTNREGTILVYLEEGHYEAPANCASPAQTRPFWSFETLALSCALTVEYSHPRQLGVSSTCVCRI